MAEKKEKISVEQIKKLPPKTLLRIIQKVKDHLKSDETMQKVFKDYNIDINEIDYIPTYFKDLDVSAKTERGCVYFNYKLLCSGDIRDLNSYATHEYTHFLQQCCSDGPSQGADDGDYLKNPFEQAAFQNQIEYIANHEGEEKATQYTEDLLEHHDKKGKEKEKLEDILMDKI